MKTLINTVCKSLLIWLPIAAALASCSSDEQSIDRLNPSVRLVKVKDGEIIQSTRNGDEDAVATLAFASEKDYYAYVGSLRKMSDSIKIKTVQTLGITPLVALEKNANHELDSIADVAKSEEEFRILYQQLADKYDGLLVRNYIDTSDLDFYINADTEDQSAYIANQQGIYVIGNEVVKVEESELPENIKILSEPVAVTASDTENALTKQYTNEYDFKMPEDSHKRVIFKATRKDEYDIRIDMTVKKKMWYGWRTDDHRFMVFEPFLQKATMTAFPSHNLFWYQNQGGISEIIAKADPNPEFKPPMAQPEYTVVTGQIYTWTDLWGEIKSTTDLSKIYQTDGFVTSPYTEPHKYAVVVNIRL